MVAAGRGGVLVALAISVLVVRPWQGRPVRRGGPSAAVAQPSASYPPPMTIDDLYAAFVRPGRASVGGRAAALAVLPAGELVLPTGRIVASDAFILSTEPFTTTVVPGRYPVALLSATDDRGLGSDVAAAMLRLAPGDPVSWQMALVAGQDATTLEPGTFFGYAVDSGTGSFTSPEAVEHVAGEPAFDAYSTRFQAAMFPTPDARNLSVDLMVDPATSANVIGFPSGFGDGGYASWFGLDCWRPAGRAGHGLRGPGRPVDLKELGRPAGRPACLTGPDRYTRSDGSPLRARAARRLRHGRVPCRARTVDHGGGAALDPGGPGRRQRLVGVGRAAQSQLDHQRLPARLHPGDAPCREAVRPLGHPPAVPGGARDLRRRVARGRPRPEPRPAHRRAAPPGRRRRGARPGRARPPQRTCTAAERGRAPSASSVP